MGSKITDAIDLFRNYKLDESRDILEEIIKVEPLNIDALVTLGRIHSRTQSYGQAMNYFQKVVEVEPNNSEAITGLQLIKNILQLTNNFYFENAYTNDNLYESND